LFIRLERSEKLIDLHNKAKMIFDINGIEYYMPHISLMYGNLDSSLKEKIISERRNSFPDTLDIKHIQLVSASVETDPAEWRVIKEFPLG
jgi:2'-5' RNA ligase